MNAFCTSCGEPLVGNFCTKCGSPKTQTDTASTNADQAAAKQEAELFAERVRRQAREREIEQERLEAERRAKEAEAMAAQKAARLEARREKLKSIRAAILRRKAIWFPVFGLLFLALAYGIGQASVTASNGPDKKLEELVTAIKNADFEALNDSSLFPGAKPEAPDWVKNSYQKDLVQGVEILSVNQSGQSATAQVGLSDQGDYFVVQLTSTTNWEGLFQVPHWTVYAIGTGGDFSPDATILKAQKLTFVNQNGGKSKTVTAKTVASWDPMSLLPGYYSVQVDKYGFSSGGTMDAGYWPQSASVSMVPVSSELKITPAVDLRADKRATYIAKHCGSIKCSRLPKYGEYDFSLWSQWDYTTYTSSSFDYHWANASCYQESAVATTPTMATFTYSCTLTAKAHLYVKWVYYYGYYSDYYYYGNYYDSTDDTISVSFNLKTYKSGK